MTLDKIHHISTRIAVYGGMLSMAAVFVATLDGIIRLNILSRNLEDLAAVAAYLIGFITITAIVNSILLSLYKISTK